MSTLSDTNLLLRRTQPDYPSHFIAVESIARLLEAGEPVYFTMQNIAEFWNVATRSQANTRRRTGAWACPLRKRFGKWKPSSGS